MRYILLTLLLTIFTSASSLLDFKYLDDAKEAYIKKDYKDAERLYSKIENDNAKFNLADTLYREKRYKDAIDIYNSINSKDLEFKKLHNIGNSYAKLNKIDEAIKSYEDALKIKDDEDTKFNLELLKKKKKEQEKKKKKQQKDKNNKNKKEDKKRDNQNKKNSQDKKDNKNSQNREKQDKNSKENKDKKKEAEEKSKKDKEKKEEKEKNKERKLNEANQTKAPISNMEERKWQKMLNKRGVNTLMLPLSRGGKKNEEENPW